MKNLLRLLPLSIFFVSFGFAAEPAAQGGSGFSTILFFVLIFAVFYLLIILPQRRKAKRTQMILGSVRVNDYVVLQSGIVVKVDKIMQINMPDPRGKRTPRPIELIACSSEDGAKFFAYKSVIVQLAPHEVVQAMGGKIQNPVSLKN